MSSVKLSVEGLRHGATGLATMGGALRSHPVHQLGVGDVGHAGLAAALSVFRDAWSAELGLRTSATTESALLLATAASDAQRLDTLLHRAAARLVSA